MPQAAVLIPPANRRLTTKARIKSELGITVLTFDDLFDRLIDEATDIIEGIVGRPLYRAQFQDTLPGTDRTRFVVSRYPVVSVDAATYDGDAVDVTDITIDNSGAGFLYRQAGFYTNGNPNVWAVTYTAGFFVPDDTLTTALSVTASDDSYNDVATQFPTHLKSGDLFVASGFTDAANNGNRVVDNDTAPTTAKIIVESGLVDEGSASRTLDFRSLPGELERACVDLVKSVYLGRQRDGNVQSLKSGDFTITYGSQAMDVAAGQLQRWAAR